MKGPIVLGLQQEDVHFLTFHLDMIARGEKPSPIEDAASAYVRRTTASRIVSEIKRQEEACRKAMRDGEYS